VQWDERTEAVAGKIFVARPDTEDFSLLLTLLKYLMKASIVKVAVNWGIDQK
jgi:hypothetical protein